MGQAGDLRQPAVIVRAHRLLVEQRIGELQLSHQSPRHRHIAAAMKVKGDLDVGADRLAHRAGAGDRGAYPAVGVDGSQGRAGIHLDRFCSLRDHHRRLFRSHRRRFVVAARPAIDLDTVAHLTAQKAMDRLIGRLADDVPQRDLDASQRAHEVRPAVIERLVETSPYQPLQVARILADKMTREFTDQSLGPIELPLDRVLPITVQSAHATRTRNSPQRGGTCTVSMASITNAVSLINV